MCTCALSAVPMPVTALFTSAGTYSSTGRPASAATSISDPRGARDRERADLVGCRTSRAPPPRGGPMLTRSPRGWRHRCRSRPLRPAGGVRTVSVQTSAGLRRSRLEHGEARPGQAGVDAEHTGIEHPFAQSRAAAGRANTARHGAGAAGRPPLVPPPPATASPICHMPLPCVTATSMAPSGVTVRSFATAFGKPVPNRCHDAGVGGVGDEHADVGGQHQAAVARSPGRRRVRPAGRR